MQTLTYIDKGFQRSVEFPVNPCDDVSGTVASASSGALKDYQDKLKAINLRERGLSKSEISEKLGRSAHWVGRWWREHPATLERPAGSNDIVLQKAALHSFRDLDIRRTFLDEVGLYDELVEKVNWRQAKVVARDQNTGELDLRFNDRGRSINAGRQVADYRGGIDNLDKILQKIFTQMDIRDPQARIFMNYYENGNERVGVHRHDFWTCLVSFGAPRILTVDNRPVLMRDRDLILFGTQNHGVPVMPGTKGGRISLVIFFYPDADNLERQWSTVAEDELEESDKSVGTVDVASLTTGVDPGFNPSLLWGDEPERTAVNKTQVAEEVLSKALEPQNPLRNLFKSEHTKMTYPTAEKRHEVCNIYSVTCHAAAGDAGAEEKTLFDHLNRYKIASLWDLRFRVLRESWSEPENLKRISSSRLVKYRHYPVGRKEAGGPIGHFAGEEGQHILKRLLESATKETTAYLSDGEDWQRGNNSRGAAGDWLESGQLNHTGKVFHILRDGEIQRHVNLGIVPTEVDDDEHATISAILDEGDRGELSHPQATVDEGCSTGDGCDLCETVAAAGACRNVSSGRALGRWATSAGPTSTAVAAKGDTGTSTVATSSADVVSEAVDQSAGQNAAPRRGRWGRKPTTS